MTFAEKISKILDTNTLGISSVKQLEDYVKAGRSAIGAHVGKNAPSGSQPGRATQKKIIEKLRVNQQWWDTGKGEIYINGDLNPDGQDPKKVMDLDVWEELKFNNRQLGKTSDHDQIIIDGLMEIVKTYAQGVNAHKI